jgi:hypothetical protein
MQKPKRKNKTKEFEYSFGVFKFKLKGKDYRDAVRRNAKHIQKVLNNQEELPYLLKVVEQQSEKSKYWNIREFLKEAGIRWVLS